MIGLVNVFLAGVTFSLIYYYTANLWAVGAMHTFWNFILGYVVGSQISGIGTYKSVLFSIPVENKDLISGGGPLILLGKKLEKEEKQKESLKNEIKKILKNYSELNEEKNFLEFLLEKL